MAVYLAKRTTRIYCDRHGWVSGRFGKIPPAGREAPSGYAKLCKGTKYYIEYCCGLKCINKMPLSLYDAIVNDPLSQELLKKAAEDQDSEGSETEG